MQTIGPNKYRVELKSDRDLRADIPRTIIRNIAHAGPESGFDVSFRKKKLVITYPGSRGTLCDGRFRLTRDDLTKLHKASIRFIEIEYQRNKDRIIVTGV